MIDYKQRISELANKLAILEAEKEYIAIKIIENNLNVASIKDELEVITKSILLLQIASSVGKKKIAQKFSSVIEDAITTITGQTHSVNIELDTRGNDIEANIVIDGHEDIINSFGGGIKDITSVVLRFLTVIMYKIDSPILLDEPTKQLSKQLYSEQIGRFFKELSKNRQIIIATHSDEVAELADNIVTIIHDGTESKVKQPEKRNV